MSTIKASAVLVAAFLGTFASPARAQETLVVKIPFPFLVRGEQMPAGKYELTADSGILSIRGADNSSRAFALTMPADGSDPAGEEPSVVFVRYENQNLLSQFWGAEGEGRALIGAARTKHDRADAETPSSIVVTATNNQEEK